MKNLKFVLAGAVFLGVFSHNVTASAAAQNSDGTQSGGGGSSRGILEASKGVSENPILNQAIAAERAKREESQVFARIVKYARFSGELYLFLQAVRFPFQNHALNSIDSAVILQTLMNLSGTRSSAGSILVKFVDDLQPDNGENLTFLNDPNSKVLWVSRIRAREDLMVQFPYSSRLYRQALAANLGLLFHEALGLNRIPDVVDGTKYAVSSEVQVVMHSILNGAFWRWYRSIQGSYPDVQSVVLNGRQICFSVSRMANGLQEEDIKRYNAFHNAIVGCPN